MFDKWLIKDRWVLEDHGEAIIKRDDDTGLVVVGGSVKCCHMMEKVVTDALGRDVPENTHTQRGRIRFEIFGVKVEQWNLAKIILIEQWFGKRISKHGRLL